MTRRTSMVAALVLVSACGGGGGSPDPDLGPDAPMEMGPSPDAGDAGQDAFVPPPGNVVFVTDELFSADFGGITAADDECQALADAAGLDGTFVAFVSTSAVDAIDRLAGSRGWWRPDGRPFADTVQDLVDGRILYPARVTATRQEVPGFSRIWTGSEAGRHVTGESCEDWTSTTSSGGALLGSAGSGNTGFGGGAGAACSGIARLLCFGTGLDVPVTVTPTPGRRAFISESTWAVGGGRPSADELCQDEATAAGLSGTFLALLAANGSSAASRFATSGLPWVRFDGLSLTETAAALFSTEERDAPFKFTADGDVLATDRFWLGGDDVQDPASPGTAESTCNGWTSSTGAVATGWGANNTFWGRTNGATCGDADVHVLCLEE